MANIFQHIDIFQPRKIYRLVFLKKTHFPSKTKGMNLIFLNLHKTTFVCC